MNTRELKQWLSKRRESRVLKHIREHLVIINSCISKSKDFYNFWKEKNKEAANNAYDLIHQDEKTADNILNKIIEMLAEGKTPEYVRADLLNFVHWADKAAGAVKRGSNNLLILLDVEFPEKLIKLLGEIIDLLIEETQTFLNVYDKMLKVEREELIQLIEKVNQLESLTDKTYREMKLEIAYNTSEMPAGALIILDHAIRDFEESCDLIEDCADILRSIVLL
ncbi:MAG: DUF47 family protein [Candidatus Heimdallarchaeota archaeon]|nr:DUF47 family protein [Candidatus Heimdallarchaeota archaeon]MCK4876010.1 DUF47 family protein [Candidatus Heimdallarchaeota archaeon]